MTRRQPSVERITETQVIYEGRKATLKVYTVDLGDGRTSTREIYELPPVAVIVPVDAEGNVVFVRQYRLATGDFMLEVPAGVSDPGESVDDCAQRELREETGLQAGKMTTLAPQFFVSPGISTEWMRLYLAEDLSEAPLDPDEDEDIAIERIPLAEAVRMAVQGELRDAKSIAGVLLAAQRLAPAARAT